MSPRRTQGVCLGGERPQREEVRDAARRMWWLELVLLLIRPRRCGPTGLRGREDIKDHFSPSFHSGHFGEFGEGRDCVTRILDWLGFVLSCSLLLSPQH